MYTAQTPLQDAFVQEAARVRNTMTVPGTQNLQLKSSVQYHSQPFQVVLKGKTSTVNTSYLNMSWLNIARDSFMVGVGRVAVALQKTEEAELPFLVDESVMLFDVCDAPYTESGNMTSHAQINFAEFKHLLTETQSESIDGLVTTFVNPIAFDSINPIVRELHGGCNMRWELNAIDDLANAIVRDVEVTLQFYPNPMWRRSY